MIRGVTAHPTWTTDVTLAAFKAWATRVAGHIDFIRFDIDWQRTDIIPITTNLIAMLSANGIRPMAMLGGTGPQWYAPDPEDYATVAADVARLLPPGGMLEIWNEPNLSKFWASPSATNYGLLLNKAYPAVKAQAPHVTVIAPSIVFNHRAYLADVLAVAPRSFDWLSIHPYTNGLVDPPDDPDEAHSGWSSFRAALLTCREMQRANGQQDFPLAITEVGWPAAGAGASHYRAAIQIAEQMGVVAFGAYQLGDRELDSYALWTTGTSGTVPTTAWNVIAQPVPRP